MPETYSTYEAKARLSEILRKVRAGKTVLISHRGEAVAEVRPIREESAGIAERLDELEQRGALVRSVRRRGTLSTIEEKPGALKRFLEDRER